MDLALSSKSFSFSINIKKYFWHHIDWQIESMESTLFYLHHHFFLQGTRNGDKNFKNSSCVYKYIKKFKRIFLNFQLSHRWILNFDWDWSKDLSTYKLQLHFMIFSIVWQWRCSKNLILSIRLCQKPWTVG